jgi:uncharacterized protein YehS (DUF1456 family)
VTKNDVLRRVRYTFDFSDSKIIALFALGGIEVSREQVSDWMKKDEDPEFKPCPDRALAAFLNGLITDRRGKKEGAEPALEDVLSNNQVLRKLRIALDLKESDMLDLMNDAEMPLSKPELSALFRNPGHKNYRECKDQFLRNFLRGLQSKYRPSGDADERT